MESSVERPTIEQLVQEHLGTLYRFAVHVCGSPTEAEDLVQETFLLAHKHLHQLREGQAALAWLFRILRNCWTRQCKQRINIEAVPVEELAEELAGPLPLVEEVDRERLSAVLMELPAEYREPLVLFYFDEFRYREIAELLDCPIGTVMSRLARAKSLLRAKLSPTPCAEKGC